MKENKKDILRHLQTEVYCKLGVSKTHGIGVFSIRDIPKGINPLNTWLNIEEIKFSKKEMVGIPSSVKKQMKIFCFYDSKYMHVPNIGLNSANMAIYLNHSKTPNVEFKINGKIQALRVIKKNEELFLDYDLSFGGIHIFK